MSQPTPVPEVDLEAVSALLPSQEMMSHTAPGQGLCADCPGRFELHMIAHVMLRLAVCLLGGVSGAGAGGGGGMFGLRGGGGGAPACPEVQ